MNTSDLRTSSAHLKPVRKSASKNGFFLRPGFVLLACIAAACFERVGHTATIHPVDLRCEYLQDPLGIDTPAPRLSWILRPTDPKGRGYQQTAYEIVVATTPYRVSRGIGDLWASGPVFSEQSIQVRYQGKPLQSGQQCYWAVRVWDRAGYRSRWSEPARWSMGLLRPGDWKGAWIGKDVATPEKRELPARTLRREFEIRKRVRRATVYFSGLGLAELYLNGRKIGDRVLSPGLTDYTKRVLYVTYDVTAELRRGPNAVGVLLGNGRYFAPRLSVPTEMVSYGYPKLLFQLEIEFSDNTVEHLVSDTSWKLTTAGPIRANNEYDGEFYDARREMPGWARPGFDDSVWEVAREIAAPGGRLCSEMIEPIRVIEVVKPISMREISPGIHVYDLGQNLVGWCRLRVNGPAGTEVTLRHSELLKPDGTLRLDNLRSAKATDTYILRGEGAEVWEPRFTYHGFRYVEMRGCPGAPDLSTLEGRVVHDDLEAVGEWACSSLILNRIYQNTRWSVRGNYRSIPTGCPQRDERQGWLGPRSEGSRGETYLFNVAALYSKWMRDIEDAQKEDGSLPDVCPAYWPLYTDNVTWPSSTVITPGNLHTQYADIDLLARHYESMKNWVAHMNGFLEGGIMTREQHGDWSVPPADPKLIHAKNPNRETAPEILATTTYYYCLRELARYAALLDKAGDAMRFRALAQRIRVAFNRKYFDADKGYYGNGTQTACILPLATGIALPHDRQPLFDHLIDRIAGESAYHVGTGLIGGQWLMRTLTRFGQSELAYRLASNTTYPSWGYMIEEDATTIWESWNGDTGDPATNSANHMMLVGDLIVWLFEDVAGIKANPAEPGFKHIVLKPYPGGSLTHVRAVHKSPYGPIASEWRLDRNRFVWEVAIPPNTTATVFVPSTDAGSVTEGGHPAASAPGVRVLRYEDGHTVLSIGSGAYRFASYRADPAVFSSPVKHSAPLSPPEIR